MKKLFILLTAAFLLPIVIACTSDPELDNWEERLSGTFIGNYWDERNGTSLEDATTRIESAITMDRYGIIVNFDMQYWQLSGDGWVSRSDVSADVTIDYSVIPTAASPNISGTAATPGNSMFTVATVDMNSFYAVGVNSDRTVAFAFADPSTRYLLEGKFPAYFDFSMPIRELLQLTHFIPTRRLSTGIVRPNNNWIDMSAYGVNLRDRNILNTTFWNHVIYRRGVFQGAGMDTTLQEFLEMAGVVFSSNGSPQPMGVKYGRHSLGGWPANYAAIREYLIGKNAREVTALVDYVSMGLDEFIDADNFFWAHPDVVSGATPTAQNSIDTISGATIRMSRENTSYQRALVSAGILSESDVIKGRP